MNKIVVLTLAIILVASMSLAGISNNLVLVLAKKSSDHSSSSSGSSDSGSGDKGGSGSSDKGSGDNGNGDTGTGDNGGAGSGSSTSDIGNGGDNGGDNGSPSTPTITPSTPTEEPKLAPPINPVLPTVKPIEPPKGCVPDATNNNCNPTPPIKQPENPTNFPCHFHSAANSICPPFGPQPHPCPVIFHFDGCIHRPHIVIHPIIEIHRTIHTSSSGGSSHGLSKACFDAIKIAWFGKVKRGQNQEVDQFIDNCLK